MEPDFWLERWREGQTHFHQERVTPLLAKYWPSLELAPGSRVLVPLCGKSLDMVWLAEQGHRVLGVELATLAVEQFFDEQRLTPVVHTSPMGVHYVAGDIEILCGDIFDLDADTLASCVGAYDRAALIALPGGMRGRYARHVYGQLPADYRGLLLTLDYPQAQMAGPPFSVPDTDVQALFAGHSHAKLLDRRNILDKEPKFAARGVQRLDTLTYRVQAAPRS